MIVIERGLVRSFRTVSRKCSIRRPKGPSPPILVSADRGRVMLAITESDVVLAVEVPVPDVVSTRIVVPAEAFEAADTAGPIEMATDDRGGLLRWVEPTGPRELRFEPLPPDGVPDPPARPNRLMPRPPTFLTALHECGRTADPGTPTRFATNRVQVQGVAGRVAGTDGKQALTWGGFHFLFSESLLVPAIPAFGVKDLVAAGDVRVGRTKDSLVVAVGPWTVFLRIDAQGRFPDVEGIVPRAAGASELAFGAADADRLLAAIPVRASANPDDDAVMLHLGPTLAARIRTAARPRVLSLAASTASGPSVAAAFNPRHLARALALGFRQVRIRAADKPIAFLDDARTYVTMPLAVEDRSVAATDSLTEAEIPEPAPERRMAPMKAFDGNGSDNCRHDPPGGAEPLDPLAEAEALKAALIDVVQRAGRLIQALKHNRKQTRVLSSAWSALKSLNLGSNGDSP